MTNDDILALGVGSVLLDKRWGYAYQSRWCCSQHCQIIWSRPDSRDWFNVVGLQDDNPDGFTLLLDQDNTKD